MFKNMKKEHKDELNFLILLAILTLALTLSSYVYYHYLNVVFFLAIYILAGKDIFKAAFEGLKRGHGLDENFLMSLATLTAFILRAYPEAIAVMLFYKFGELFEEIATSASRDNIKSLLNLVDDVALRINEDGSTEEVDIDDIEVGDVILLRDGDKVGVDGVVIEGNGLLDTSAISGESIPVEVSPGSDIISSSIMTDGIIKYRASKEFDDSIAAKIMELIEDSASSKSDSEKFITKFARVYTPIVVGLAVAIALIPPLFFGARFDDYLIRAAIFLVLSCPCALVLSVPLSFMSGLGLASSNGFLIKGSTYFETLDKADILLTDKTGTLTTGDFVIEDITYLDDYQDKDKLLSYLYNIELMSSHPIARGIVKSLDLTEDKDLFKEVKNEKGLGIRALSKSGEDIRVGSSKYVGYEDTLSRSIYMKVDEKIVLKVDIADDIKDKSRETVKELRSYFKEISLISGDSKKQSEGVGRELDLDRVYAEKMPAEKLDILNSYKKDSQGVVFVGDGINDAPVLKNADCAIAMGEAASDLAIESSDILLVSGEFSELSKLMKIVRLTLKTVKENIIFIMAIKIAILILGLFGKANMWMAIFGDVGTSIISILWAMRILKKKI